MRNPQPRALNGRGCGFFYGVDEGAVEKILLSRYAASILFLGKGGSTLVGKGGI